MRSVEQRMTQLSAARGVTSANHRHALLSPGSDSLLSTPKEPSIAPEDENVHDFVLHDHRFAERATRLIVRVYLAGEQTDSVQQSLDDKTHVLRAVQALCNALQVPLRSVESILAVESVNALMIPSLLSTDTDRSEAHSPAVMELGASSVQSLSSELAESPSEYATALSHIVPALLESVKNLFGNTFVFFPLLRTSYGSDLAVEGMTAMYPIIGGESRKGLEPPNGLREAIMNAKPEADLARLSPLLQLLRVSSHHASIAMNYWQELLLSSAERNALQLYQGDCHLMLVPIHAAVEGPDAASQGDVLCIFVFSHSNEVMTSLAVEALYMSVYQICGSLRLSRNMFSYVDTLHSVSEYAMRTYAQLGVSEGPAAAQSIVRQPMVHLTQRLVSVVQQLEHECLNLIPGVQCLTLAYSVSDIPTESIKQHSCLRRVSGALNVGSGDSIPLTDDVLRGSGSDDSVAEEYLSVDDFVSLEELFNAFAGQRAVKAPSVSSKAMVVRVIIRERLSPRTPLVPVLALFAVIHSSVANIRQDKQSRVPMPRQLQTKLLLFGKTAAGVAKGIVAEYVACTQMHLSCAEQLSGTWSSAVQCFRWGLSIIESVVKALDRSRSAISEVSAFHELTALSNDCWTEVQIMWNTLLKDEYLCVGDCSACEQELATMKQHRLEQLRDQCIKV